MLRWAAVLGLAGVVIGVSACGTELTTSGTNVQVGKGHPEDMTCTDLGVIYGEGGGGDYTSAHGKLESAENDLRNQAANRGANFVDMDVGTSDRTSVSISGHALKCVPKQPREFAAGDRVNAPTPSAPPASAPPTASAAPAAESAPSSQEQRLRSLDQLHQKGLVTDAEYQQRRKEIIDSI